MCTLMQKDVLIEEVSATASFIAYRTPLNTKSEDLIECSEIRENLLITSPQHIDKQNILNRLKFLKDKYLKLPIFSYYLVDSENA